MRDFISWYNKNRIRVWVVIAIIAFLILLVHLLNDLIKNNNEQGKNSGLNNSKNKSYNTIALEDNSSVITGKDMSKSQTESLSIIDKFVEYCNGGYTAFCICPNP